MVVDGHVAGLVKSFGSPQTVEEAIHVFATANRIDETAAVKARSILTKLVKRGFLAPFGQENDTECRAIERLGRIGGLTVVRQLSPLADAGVYLARSLSAEWAVLKIQRRGSETERDGLEREARALELLAGRGAPKPLADGEYDGRRYLAIEWCAGIAADRVAAEWRSRPGRAARSELLKLCRAVARTYARLHSLGVLHGDVHPGNVLVDPLGDILLIDFGLMRLTVDEPRSIHPARRGGVAFFYDPALARALSLGEAPPEVTELDEQYSVAVLLDHLLTGTYYLDFRLEREALLRQVIEEPPLGFGERGCSPWPEVESILRRALHKHAWRRFPSMELFARALDAVAPAGDSSMAVESEWLLGAKLESEFVQRTDSDGMGFGEGLARAPRASVYHGSAGIALALQRIASMRRSATLLSRANHWASRSEISIGMPGAFDNPELGMSPREVGRCSPYHTESGVHAVRALVAAASNDSELHRLSVTRFIRASGRTCKHLDVVLGTSGQVLVTALLLDSSLERDVSKQLANLGGPKVAQLTERLGDEPAITDSELRYLGIAHGWAGYLYALLQWSRATRSGVTRNLQLRLEQLADLAVPMGRGMAWPRTVPVGNAPGVYSSSWCHGTAGQVFLWSLAHQLTGSSDFLALARGAAWHTWDATGRAGHLCCGLTGRSYALLRFYRSVEEPIWLERARDLARRAAADGEFEERFDHSLFRGKTGLAALACDLGHPGSSSMPLFEESAHSA